MRRFYLQWENPQILVCGFGRRNLLKDIVDAVSKLTSGDVPVVDPNRNMIGITLNPS
jgi:hypothetical protein